MTERPTPYQVNCCVGILFTAVGCAPSMYTSSNAVRAPKSSTAAQCYELANQAEEFEKNHRGLRAQLYRERANSLCPTFREPQPQLPPSNEALEEVYRWIAHEDPTLFLRTERLTSEPIAQKLENSVHWLERSLGQRLTLDVKSNSRAHVEPLTEDWLTLSGGSLSREGEWFERYVFPECETNWIIGPLAGSLVICGTEDQPDKVYRFIDFPNGKTLETRQIGRDEYGNLDRTPPLAFGNNRFVLATWKKNCDDYFLSPSMDCPNEIEIWQASPLKRLAAYHDIQHTKATAPATNAASPVTPTRRRAGVETSHEDPLTTESDEFIVRMEQARQARLAGISRVGSDLLAIHDGLSTLVVDPLTLEEKVLLPSTQVAASSSGRHLAFETREHELGLYDRETGRARSFPVPIPSAPEPPVLSENQRWLATGSNENDIRLFDVNSGRLERTFSVPRRGGAVRPLQFIEGDRWLLVMQGERLRKFDVATGKEASLTTDNSHVKSSRIGWRHDGSAFFFDANGCVTEEVASGKAIAQPACAPNRDYRVSSHDGEWLLRQWSIRLGRKDIDSLELVSTRDGRVAGNFSVGKYVSADGVYFGYRAASIVFAGGPVIQREGTKMIWPSAGIPSFQNNLEIHGSLARLTDHSTIDLHSGEVQLAAPRPRTERSVETKANACATRYRDVVRAGEFEIQCDYDTNDLVLCREEKEVTRVPGCHRVMSLSPSGNYALVRDDHGYALLNLRTKQSRPWSPSSWAARVPEVHLGYDGEAFAITGGSDQPTTAWLFGKGSAEPTWKVALPAHPKDIRFTSDANHSMVLGIMNGALYGWDLSTGKPRGYWPDANRFGAFAQFGERSLLAFPLETGVRFARIDPAETLFDVHVDGPQGNAVIVAPDGRFELLGDHERAARSLRCRVGHRVVPTSACAERYEWPGLLKELLRSL